GHSGHGADIENARRPSHGIVTNGAPTSSKGVGAITCEALCRVGRLSTMSQAQNFDLTKPPVGQRRCPHCGLPMFLSQVDQIVPLQEDQRTSECVQCPYAETVVVQFS